MAIRRIGYLTPWYFDRNSRIGGGERYPLNLARGVVEASRGTYAVDLISFGSEPYRRSLDPGVGLRVLRSSPTRTSPSDQASWELLDAFSDADLVHIHQTYTRPSELGILVAKLQGKPICVTDHGGMSSHLGERVKSLELADRIIVYSDFGASLYRTGTSIDVIKGGIDASQFTPAPAPIRREFALFVGRLLPHKGIDRLIAALPPGLPLVICGRPHHDGYFQLLQGRVGRDVRFVSDADDAALVSLYRHAWATVLPSVYLDCYGQAYKAPGLMGYSLLESMSCGTPAIASRAGGLPEFVRDGETGLVYDDPEGLTRALRLLASSPALVERMGRRARLVVEREYDIRVVGARLLAIYKSLISRRIAVGA